MTAVESVAIPNGRDPDEALEKLMHVGLVWKTPDMDWVPGIPSLCAFLVEREGAPTK